MDLVAGQVVNLCLGGFVAAIRITSLLGMGMLRNTFVTSVCRFTMLHAPQSMQLKNAHAFRALLVVADENGNHMHVSLLPLVKVFAACVSNLVKAHTWRMSCLALKRDNNRFRL